MPDLATFQRNFAEAILSGGTSEFDRFPGFAIYRNNSALRAVESLERAYPTVRKLLGGARFRDVAREFFDRRPPKSAVMAEYGAEFGDRLEHLSTRFPYAADIARIDHMRRESHLSEDPQPKPGLRCDAVGAAEWMTTIAILHPATRFEWFDSPAPSVWIALQGKETPDAPMSARGAEGALVTRMTGETVVTRIGRLDYRLLRGFAEGKRVGPTAIELAMEQPDENPDVAFKRLLESGAILRLQKEEN